jgi:hypothetical protein
MKVRQGNWHRGTGRKSDLSILQPDPSGCCQQAWSQTHPVWTAVCMTVCQGICKVGQNHVYIRCIYDIWCIYGIFGRKITKHTVIYSVCIRFWPTLGTWHWVTRLWGDSDSLITQDATRTLDQGKLLLPWFLRLRPNAYILLSRLNIFKMCMEPGQGHM